MLIFDDQLREFQDIKLHPIERSAPSGFYLDIIWTDKSDITLKATKQVYFKNDLSVCRDMDLYQSDCIFDQMSVYFPILNKMDDKSEIKKSISKSILEMAKSYNTENRITTKHLKFVYDDNTILINIRI